MAYITNLDPVCFLFSLVLNLAYIDYSLCQIRSVYMQYLRCCDYSNKCLFLVIQQAEVLLNFFGECIYNADQFYDDNKINSNYSKKKIASTDICRYITILSV